MLHKARDQNNGFIPIPLFKMTMVYVAYLSATAKQMPQSSNDFFSMYIILGVHGIQVKNCNWLDWNN